MCFCTTLRADGEGNPARAGRRGCPPIPRRASAPRAAPADRAVWIGRGAAVDPPEGPRTGQALAPPAPTSPRTYPYRDQREFNGFVECTPKNLSSSSPPGIDDLELGKPLEVVNVGRFTYAVWTALMSRPMCSGSKNSTGDTVPAVMLANASIASWSPCTAPNSCCISGGGASSVANWVVNS